MSQIAYNSVSTDMNACPRSDRHCYKLSLWISFSDIRLPDVDLPRGIQHDHWPAALVVTTAFQSKRQSIIRSLRFAGTWLAARICRLGPYSTNQPLGRSTQRARWFRGHAGSGHWWVSLKSYTKITTNLRIPSRQILSEIAHCRWIHSYEIYQTILNELQNWPWAKESSRVSNSMLQYFAVVM